MTVIPADDRSRDNAEEVVKIINEMASGVQFYDSSHASTSICLPFRVSPAPFWISKTMLENLKSHCRDLVAYYWACEKLLPVFATMSQTVARLIASRPTDFGATTANRHPLIRPDFILTATGPVVVEIETSLFGLGLSCFLEKSYRDLGFETLGDHASHFDGFARQMSRSNSKRMALAYTNHTKRYAGQLSYLASLMARKDLDVISTHVENIACDVGSLSHKESSLDHIYRAFYLHEGLDNTRVRRIVENHAAALVPGANAALEEKALLALIWDPTFEVAFTDYLGSSTVACLRKVIPPTFIVDAEDVPSHFGNGIKRWVDLASLSRKDRKFALKVSGFSERSSWGIGVEFLQECNADAVATLIEEAANSETFYVLQAYRDGAKHQQLYHDTATDKMETMNGRVRLTPYVSTATGEIVTAKATLRSGSKYIHGATDAVNTAVSIH